MSLESYPKFDDFFLKADEITKEVLRDHETTLSILRQIHSSFRLVIDAATKNETQFDALLLMSSLSVWLASIREASTGNHAATMPLFRAALEAACYAYRIAEKPDLERVWLDRHNDDVSRRKCVDRFGRAVSDVARRIVQRNRVSAENRQWIMEAYEASIDFGAHPNIKSITNNLRINQDRDDGMVGVSFNSIHSAGSFEVKRALLSSIEYGQVILLIGTFCAKEPTDELVLKMHEINTLKEEYLRTEFESEE